MDVQLIGAAVEMDGWMTRWMNGWVGACIKDRSQVGGRLCGAESVTQMDTARSFRRVFAPLHLIAFASKLVA